MKNVTTCTHEKLCVICDEALFGRSDRRFCSYKCKNKYHADVRRTAKHLAKDQLQLLHKNRRILSELLDEKVTEFEINKIVLQRKGFDFQCVSGFKMTDFGIQLNVLDFTWYLKKNQIVNVKYNPEQAAISPYVYKRIKRFGMSETS